MLCVSLHRDLLCGGSRLHHAPQVVRDIATLVAVRTMHDKLNRLGPRGLPLVCAEVWAPHVVGAACSPAAAAADAVRGPAASFVCAFLDAQVNDPIGSRSTILLLCNAALQLRGLSFAIAYHDR